MLIPKPLSRKDFLVKTLSGITGIGLISKQTEANDLPEGYFKKPGNTGNRVSPLCFGDPMANDESLIKYSVEKGISFINTGRSYGKENNERLVGRAVSGRRNNEVFR